MYDVFMEEVPYDAWCARILEKLRQNGIEDGLLCELGCGTGNMTVRLAAAGYDMIGIDASADMLAAARQKELSGKEAGTAKTPDILYLLQDMREFELYGTVRAVVSVCDSLNYITEEEELLEVFRLVNNYLDPGGIFLFDMNTAAGYAEIGDSVIAENRPEGSFIWENEYDPESGLNRYDLTLFLPEGGLYRKCEETHFERAYSAETIRRLLEEAGLVFGSAEEAYTGKPVSAGAKRILFSARETRKMRNT